MSIAASEGELDSGDEDLAALLPSGRVVLSELDPELTAMLSRAVKMVGLEWREPLCPQPSSSDPGLMEELRTANGPRPESDESHCALPGSDYGHAGGPGPPSLAEPGGYAGDQQILFSRLPYLPGRPILRCSRELCRTVLGCPEADGGY